MKTINDIRIGAILRADATGLGNQAQDWAANLPIQKGLVVWGEKPSDPSVFAGLKLRVCEMGIPTLNEADWLLEDIDLLLIWETPYNWSIIKKAKEKGVKTIINPNYEWQLMDIPEEPDLWLCTNILNYDTIATSNKVFIPQPINRGIFPFKLRKKARIFLFNNGNGGAWGRNCLKEFLEAINFVQADVRFVINSQVPVELINDKRISLTVGDQQIGDIWKEGDVFIHLRKFGAMSLPQNEAMSLGMPIIGVNRKPENTMFPPELLIESDAQYMHNCRQDTLPVVAEVVSPLKVAAKIDELANTDISELSKKMDKMADEWSWKRLKPEYIKCFEKLINK